ncbi:hypothetical protein ACOSP7_016882 [Xanthoceras sorbifolium]
MVKSEVEETNNSLELLQNMNMKVEEEYKGLGDFSSGGRFDDYVQQIDAIENQVSNFKTVISMLDQYVYVSLLESKMLSLSTSTPIHLGSIWIDFLHGYVLLSIIIWLSCDKLFYSVVGVGLKYLYSMSVTHTTCTKFCTDYSFLYDLGSILKVVVVVVVLWKNLLN